MGYTPGDQITFRRAFSRGSATYTADFVKYAGVPGMVLADVTSPDWDGDRRALIAESDIVDPADAPQIGDVVFLFRQQDAEDAAMPPVLMRHAVLAALRQAGLLPTTDPARDARDLAEFKARGGAISKPQIRTLGRSGWNA